MRYDRQSPATSRWKLLEPRSSAARWRSDGGLLDEVLDSAMQKRFTGKRYLRVQPSVTSRLFRLPGVDRRRQWTVEGGGDPLQQCALIAVHRAVSKHGGCAGFQQSGFERGFSIRSARMAALSLLKFGIRGVIGQFDLQVRAPASKACAAASPLSGCGAGQRGQQTVADSSTASIADRGALGRSVDLRNAGSAPLPAPGAGPIRTD